MPHRRIFLADFEGFVWAGGWHPRTCDWIPRHNRLRTCAGTKRSRDTGYAVHRSFKMTSSPLPDSSQLSEVTSDIAASQASSFAIPPWSFFYRESSLSSTPTNEKTRGRHSWIWECNTGGTDDIKLGGKVAMTKSRRALSVDSNWILQTAPSTLEAPQNVSPEATR
jgi:hypothetical protein